MLNRRELAQIAIGFYHPQPPKKRLPGLNRLFKHAIPTQEEIHIIMSIAESARETTWDSKG